MSKKCYTKNIKVAMYLAECEHEASLVISGHPVICDVCGFVPQRLVGTILVSLDKEGFLTAKSPLRVREASK